MTLWSYACLLIAIADHRRFSAACAMPNPLLPAIFISARRPGGEEPMMDPVCLFVVIFAFIVHLAHDRDERIAAGERRAMEHCC